MIPIDELNQTLLELRDRREQLIAEFLRMDHNNNNYGTGRIQGRIEGLEISIACITESLRKFDAD